ncbi:MAG TPA: cytochrome P450 [Candidatus Binatia bacterium]|jgi:cholest-4-en-3-one 26-monooxygenase|nr:cytochrome P450 [Candidatus Binatia bacterium]
MTPPDIEVISPDYYAEHGYPHEAWAWLRRHDPVRRYELPNYRPFWTIVRHEDVFRISRDPQHFINAPRLAVFPADTEDVNNPPLRHLINMDPPEHQTYRGLTSKRFTPRALERLRPTTETVVAELLHELQARDEIDFVTEFSAIVPLAVIADLLGVPREDWRQLFRWTNEIIAPADPEFGQGADAAAITATFQTAIQQMFAYFTELVALRARQPRDDIASTLAAARLDSHEIPAFELMSYFVLLIVAGNETTRNAITGGVRALMDNRGELAKLQANPSGLARAAAEEAVRWTSPVIQFCRTAVADVELHGRTIPAGESVVLFYPSANRDETVFDEPNTFRIDRDPNPHLGFGIGEHVCLGAHLARLELQVVLARLAERVTHIELAGDMQRVRSSFVGGVKHMPIRWTLRPS